MEIPAATEMKTLFQLCMSNRVSVDLRFFSSRLLEDLEQVVLEFGVEVSLWEEVLLSLSLDFLSDKSACCWWLSSFDFDDEPEPELEPDRLLFSNSPKISEN